MYFIAGNTLVNKRFYTLPIKCYKLSINVVGHLHLVLATGLEFLLFPPSQKEGRFSGLNYYHHCHDWNLCCHLVILQEENFYLVKLVLPPLRKRRKRASLLLGSPSPPLVQHKSPLCLVPTHCQLKRAGYAVKS